MHSARTLLSDEKLELCLERMCHQLVERFDGAFDAVVMVGLQTGGVALGQRMQTKLADIIGLDQVPPLGKLDITFYRDDFKQKNLSASAMDMPFLVENKQVVLIDDVLFTGRSISAALAALSDYGRAQSIDLLVLVDRCFQRQLPIQPDIFGIVIDTMDEAYVEVALSHDKTGGTVLLFPKKQ